MSDDAPQADPADDADEALIETILRMAHGTAGSAPARPAESEANSPRTLVHPGAPPCTLAHPTEKLQCAKRSQFGEAAPGIPAARPGALAPRKIRAARLLLAGGGVMEVAAAVGVSRHTITRWVKDPAFQAEARRQDAAAVPLPAGRRGSGRRS